MKSRMFLAAVSAAALACLAPAANATVVTAVFTGYVQSGTDTTGVFGAPNSSLAGDVFTAVFTEVDGPGYGQYFPCCQDYLYGGTSNAGTVSPVSGTLTINGITLVFPGLYFGEVSQQTLASSTASILYNAEDLAFTGTGFTSDALGASVSSTVDSFIANADYHVPFSYVVQPGDNPSDNFNYVAYSFSTGSYSTEVNGTLDTTSLCVSTTGVCTPPPTSGTSVPEPSTWMMLLSGLAALGLMFRKRSRHAKAPICSVAI